MIGNDIVSLPQVACNARMTRYGEKIFTQTERKLLQRFDPQLQIALAWSVKESAYKCYSRQSPSPFIPGQYCICSADISKKGIRNICTDHEDNIRGRGFDDVDHLMISVSAPSGLLAAKSIFCQEFVFTIAAASQEEIEKIHWGIKRIHGTDYRQQSLKVRENFLHHLRQEQNIGDDVSYEISPGGKLPELYLDSLKSNLLISFSHDHQFVGHAYKYPDLK